MNRDLFHIKALNISSPNSYRLSISLSAAGTCHRRSFCISPNSDHSFPYAKDHYTQRPRKKMSALGNRGTLGIRAVAQSTALTPACCVRSFSVLNRPPPKYPGHVPLTFVERGALAVGSAVGSLLNPRRGGSNPN